MPDRTRAPKELVREYLEHRTYAPLEPPPSAEEIRHQLGWHLLPAARQPDGEDSV